MKNPLYKIRIAIITGTENWWENPYGTGIKRIKLRFIDFLLDCLEVRKSYLYIALTCAVICAGIVWAY